MQNTSQGGWTTTQVGAEIPPQQQGAAGQGPEQGKLMGTETFLIAWVQNAPPASVLSSLC